MNDPAFSPVTTTEILIYLVVISVMAIGGSMFIQWSHRRIEKQECRANHPTSKGLPRK